MGICGGNKEENQTSQLDSESQNDNCNMRTIDGDDDRKVYALGSESFKHKFPMGHHNVCLLVKVSELQSDAMSGFKKWKLFLSRGKNKVLAGTGAHTNRKSTRDGQVEMSMDQYFHDDGKPDPKRVKLELFIDDVPVGVARFNIGIYYDGEE